MLRNWGEKYYLAMRKNEILPFATTWMELEGIMLSEISQSEKDIYFHSYEMWNLRNVKTMGEGKRKKQFQTERRNTIRDLSIQRTN